MFSAAFTTYIIMFSDREPLGATAKLNAATVTIRNGFTTLSKYELRANGQNGTEKPKKAVKNKIAEIKKAQSQILWDFRFLS